MYSFKISSHVSFPLEGLDLRPFLAKECTSQITTYDLLSVICHHGTAGSESAAPASPLSPSPGASVTSLPLPPQVATTSPTAKT